MAFKALRYMECLLLWGGSPPKFYSTFPTTTGMKCLVVKTAWKMDFSILLVQS